MKRHFLAILAFVVLGSPVYAESGKESDIQIKKQIIAASIASYPGKCPCPYNVTRNGSACGGRSAYSKPGGYAPICYDRDVTSQMIADYKKGHQ